MNRRLVWLLALDSLLGLLIVRRYLELQDAWQREAHALAVHEKIGAP